MSLGLWNCRLPDVFDLEYTFVWTIMATRNPPPTKSLSKHKQEAIRNIAADKDKVNQWRSLAD